jgi:hypothetical protein
VAIGAAPHLAVVGFQETEGSIAVENVVTAAAKGETTGGTRGHYGGFAGRSGDEAGTRRGGRFAIVFGVEQFAEEDLGVEGKIPGLEVNGWRGGK